MTIVAPRSLIIIGRLILHDDQKDLPREVLAAPRPKPRSKATMGFACGGGPCRVFRIYENEPEAPKLPAPTEPKPDEAPPMNGAD